MQDSKSLAQGTVKLLRAGITFESLSNFLVGAFKVQLTEFLRICISVLVKTQLTELKKRPMRQFALSFSSYLNFWLKHCSG